MNNTSITLLRTDNVSALRIGDVVITVDDYEIKSSASGKTELTVKIIIDCSTVEFLAGWELREEEI